MVEMNLCEMTEKFAKEVCGWKYEGVYSVYNYPSWEACYAQGWAIADAIKRKREYSAVIMKEDGKSVLCGELRFSEREGIVTLGCGLHPDFCGKGYGVKLMELAIDEHKHRFPGKVLELDVRPFNERAIKCYLRSGFHITERYIGETPTGKTEFLRMRYNGS